MSIEHIKVVKKNWEICGVRDSERSIKNPANPIILRILIQTTLSLTSGNFDLHSHAFCDIIL